MALNESALMNALTHFGFAMYRPPSKHSLVLRKSKHSNGGVSRQEFTKVLSGASHQAASIPVAYLWVVSFSGFNCNNHGS